MRCVARRRARTCAVHSETDDGFESASTTGLAPAPARASVAATSAWITSRVNGFCAAAAPIRAVGFTAATTCAGAERQTLHDNPKTYKGPLDSPPPPPAQVSGHAFHDKPQPYTLCEPSASPTPPTARVSSDMHFRTALNPKVRRLYCRHHLCGCQADMHIMTHIRRNGTVARACHRGIWILYVSARLSQRMQYLSHSSLAAQEWESE